MIENVYIWYIDCLVQECCNSIANSLELLQSCTKPSIFHVSTNQSNTLTHWDIVKLTSIDLDNGLSPGWHQAIIWINAGILLIGPLGTNFSEILIEIQNIFTVKNTFENVICQMSAILSRLNVLTVKWDSWV